MTFRLAWKRAASVHLECGIKTNMAEKGKGAEAGSEMAAEDIIAGNVNKHAVFPPGYCGPPRKGHLVLDACFESGNLGRVDYITEFEYDLFVRPDTCNPRFRVWFNFTVENTKESQTAACPDCCTSEMF
ncbi:cytosolic carboxypeptidase 6 [Pleurodeles waltl]|uniref:cytosolic carboxypeptidase 6 n=1 Tax=Pleurodeles waltl TaxID=8319 RepID=UPI00370979D4